MAYLTPLECKLYESHDLGLVPYPHNNEKPFGFL